MFVRGGLVTPGNHLDVAGYDGYYWSSVSINSNLAYGLSFGPNGVYPSLSYYRYFGQPVRCVALGS